MTELKEHPEGVEVAIDIIKNTPPELLEKFLVSMDELPYLRNSTMVHELWEETIEEWFKEK